MSDEFWKGLFVGLPALLVALTGFYKIRQDVKQVHVAVNSRMDELLAVTKDHAATTGRAQGVSMERAAQVLRAEADKTAQVLRAEADKTAQVLRAEADKTAQVLRDEGGKLKNE